jgi:hypothetical protein
MSLVETTGRKLIAKASIGAYVVLCGPWFALAIFYLFLVLSREGVGGVAPLILCSVIGACWYIWLRGFKLEIDCNEFSYRDGFYRLTSFPVSEIGDVKNAWVSWKVLTRHLKVPRLLIYRGGRRGEKVEVNVKPFRRKDYQAIFAALKGAADLSVR